MCAYTWVMQEEQRQQTRKLKQNSTAEPWSWSNYIYLCTLLYSLTGVSWDTWLQLQLCLVGGCWRLTWLDSTFLIFFGSWRLDTAHKLNWNQIVSVALQDFKMSVGEPKLSWIASGVKVRQRTAFVSLSGCENLSVGSMWMLYDLNTSSLEV